MRTGTWVYLGCLVWAAIASTSNVAQARPYGVPKWNQHRDFRPEIGPMDTDFFWPGPPVVQLRYNELADPDADGNDANDTIYTTGSQLYLQPPVQPGSHDFTTAEYDELIGNGQWHCAPTSFGMAHSYWLGGGLPIHATIHEWARRLDTDDINRENRPAGLDIRPGLNLPTNIDNIVHYGTLIPDNETGVESARPGAPWPEWYESTLHTGFAAPPTTAQKTPYWAEIRAGRPTKVGAGGHATLGVDFDPAVDEVGVHDPATGAVGEYGWGPPAPDDHQVANFVTMQPHMLPDLTAGNRVYFSNDNFGTGQANVQAPGGDAGDVFGSSLAKTYGQVWDDASDNDYDDGNVTNGLDAFDVGGMDVVKSIMRIQWLTYSIDHGDPNPHDWVPGVNPGSESYSANELFVVATPDRGWYTLGMAPGALRPTTATEEQLGLNRAETSLPKQPLDDDVDAVELEFDAEQLYYTPDFLDTRVFPELTPDADLPAGREHFASPTWGGSTMDPTDVYTEDGYVLIDGEAAIGLSEHTDIDAINLFTPVEDHHGFDHGYALLFSVDASGDAPDARGRFSAGGPLEPLSPNVIYYSFLNGYIDGTFMTLPVDVDVDAIVFTPEPGMLLLLSFGAVPTLVRRRRK